MVFVQITHTHTHTLAKVTASVVGTHEKEQQQDVGVVSPPESVHHTVRVND